MPDNFSFDPNTNPQQTPPNMPEQPTMPAMPEQPAPPPAPGMPGASQGASSYSPQVPPFSGTQAPGQAGYTQRPYTSPPYQAPYQQQQPGYIPPYYPPAVTPRQPGDGMAVASLVLGIISVVLCCVWFFSLPCAIIGLILGIVAKARGTGGMAVAGLILSVCGLGLSVFLLIGIILGDVNYWVNFNDYLENDGFDDMAMRFIRIFRR